jgi:hypothetical protein
MNGLLCAETVLPISRVNKRRHESGGDFSSRLGYFDRLVLLTLFGIHIDNVLDCARASDTQAILLASVKA